MSAWKCQCASIIASHFKKIKGHELARVAFIFPVPAAQCAGPNLLLLIFVTDNAADHSAANSTGDAAHGTANHAARQSAGPGGARTHRQCTDGNQQRKAEGFDIVHGIYSFYGGTKVKPVR